jgi:hypothetical protein
MTPSPHVLVRLLKALPFALFLSAAAALAQWSGDPAVNNPVAERAGTETIPLVVSTSDGGTYIAWFDPTDGSFQVRLQRLNAVGVEQWAHNGIVISSHPQNSALFGWDMIADSSDNAVIVFSDQRNGGDLDIYAYRISPSGQFLWGPDGVTLSNNPDFEPAPRVVEASDGDFVFVWQRDPSSGDADIRMQRLSPAGAPLLALGGVPIVASLNEDPGFAIMAPADNGSVIVGWLRNIRSFSSPRHLRARKFSPAVTPLWASHVIVYDLFPLPIGYFPEIRRDGAGGAVALVPEDGGRSRGGVVRRGRRDVVHAARRRHRDPFVGEQLETGRMASSRPDVGFEPHDFDRRVCRRPHPLGACVVDNEDMIRWARLS